MPPIASDVSVAAPSRLHFGMFSFNDPSQRQFGGVGAMIEQPGLRLRIVPSETLETTGALSDRTAAFARRWAESRKVRPPACRIDVLAAPPEHVGLGVGTQLALAIGAGLNTAYGYPPATPKELAICMGRGLRSAVGTYGFFDGGLVIEEGKLADETLAPLVERIALPTSWRFVVLRPGDYRGLSGEEERAAFRELPRVPIEVTERLWELVNTAMAPAARRRDFERFSESVYQFGLMAGTCFAVRQGGPFASPRLASWVASIREMGVSGVGQSSWGPTLFAILPDQATAEQFRQEFRERHADETIEHVITAPNNCGARIHVNTA